MLRLNLQARKAASPKTPKKELLISQLTPMTRKQTGFGEKTENTASQSALENSGYV